MFNNILVPLDGSVLAEQAVGTAALLARESKGSLDLVTVLEPLPFAGFEDAPWNGAEWNARQKYIESTASELTMGAGVPASGTILRGSAVDKLCERERAIHADLVVMTSHGRSGLSRAWLGSIADAMIRHSTAPVLVLRPDREVMHPSKLRRAFSHVLVPLDGSSLSAEIVSHAIDLAAIAHARVTLLRVVTPLPLVNAYAVGMPTAYTPYMTDEAATQDLAKIVGAELTDMVERLRETTTVKIESAVVVNDHVAQAIMDFAKANQADVIAMSTHGRGASRFLLGSVADKVLRGAGTPVLMHHPADVGADTTLVTEPSVCERLPALGTAT